MNMQKLGTFTQSKSNLKNPAQSAVNPMNSGLPAIHYAYYRGRKSTSPAKFLFRAFCPAFAELAKQNNEEYLFVVRMHIHAADAHSK